MYRCITECVLHLLQEAKKDDKGKRDDKGKKGIYMHVPMCACTI